MLHNDVMHGSVHENGVTVLDDVEIRVMDIENAGRLQWFGSFEAPAHSVKEGGRYRLVLNDGRSGTILIENTEASPENDGLLVGFMGAGQLI